MGIDLPLSEFTISLTVYPYGCFLSLSILITSLYAAFTFRKAKIRQGALTWFLLFAIPLGLLFSRLSCCLCCLDQTLQYIEEDGLLYLLSFNRGGLMIFGAMAGCFTALLITSRITGCARSGLADALAEPVMLLIALRKLCDIVTVSGFGWPIGEWFSGEGMSLFTLEDPSFFSRLPFGLPDMYDGSRWAVCVLESLIALILLAVLIRRRNTRAGGKAVLMLILYASTQLLTESMRQDVIRWGFVRANQIIGAILLVLLLILCLRQVSPEKRRGLTATAAVMLFLGYVIIMAMEFALEGKISLIESWPLDVCYLVMSAGMALTMTACLKAWKAAFLK